MFTTSKRTTDETMTNAEARATAATFTALEQKTVSAFVACLYAEPGFSDVNAPDLVVETGIPMAQMRGVLSSLTQKGVLDVDEEFQHGGYGIIYLRQKFYFLHPDEYWQAECK